jgi:hypothetical protein
VVSRLVCVCVWVKHSTKWPPEGWDVVGVNLLVNLLPSKVCWLVCVALVDKVLVAQ